MYCIGLNKEGGIMIHLLKEAIDQNKSVAHVTITKDKGSSPRGVGSSMLVDEQGLIAGTIGGGAIEKKAIEDAKKQLMLKTSETIYYPLKDLNMTCGGDVEIFIHVYPKKESVLIIGAGHICQSLVPILMTLNYHVTVLDQRENVFDHPVFEGVTCIQNDIVTGLHNITFDEQLNVVIVTHGHEYDGVALAYTLSKPHRYVGMIGSSNKIQTCFEALKEKGYTHNQLASVHAPIGLNLGGESPAEIALSIAAELLCKQYNNIPSHLKDLKGVL